MKKVIGAAIITIVFLFLVVGLVVLAVLRPAMVVQPKRLAPGLPVEVGKRDISQNVISQSAPSSGYLSGEERVIGGTEVQPTPLEISQMKINLILDADYAEQGERKLTSSDVDFKGEFLLKNPLKEEADLTFSMPLPTEGGMITNVALLIGDKEPEGVTYEQNQISWTDKFAPAEEKKVSVTYKTKAIKNYRFALTHGKRIPSLLVNMVVKGTKKVSYPTDTLTPTKRKKTANGCNLEWSFDKLITSYDVGVDLPEKRPSVLDLTRVLYGGPFFLLLFLISLVAGTGAVKLKREFEMTHFAILMAAFALFYPLVLTLSAYINPLYAFVISLGVVFSLITIYLVITYGFKFGLVFGALPVLVLLGFFSFALSVPKYTAILVTLGILVLVIMAMSATLKPKPKAKPKPKPKAKPKPKPKAKPKPKRSSK